MNVIYKYTLPEPYIHVENPYVMLPVGAKILDVQYQRYHLVLWAIVDPDQKQTERRRIDIVPTGVTIPSGELRHISTLQVLGGEIIIHVFENLGEGGAR